MSLKEDYKDAVLASGTLRKYQMINNSDGTVSFQDVSKYSQAGDKAQASVFNDTNKEVNAHEGRTDNPHQVTAAQVGAIPASASCNKNWNWSGQSGQPSWLWGSNDGSNMYVYNPSNFSVTLAAYAHYSSHAVGLADFGLRGNFISSAAPYGGSDGDTWDQV